jgi:hypothetical protein
MAATSGTLIVSYRVLEAVDVEPGHWCPHCALPSACKIILASQIQIGAVLGPLKLSTGLRCTDGHGWLNGTFISED